MSLQILANIDKRGLVKYFGSDEEVLKRGNVKGTVTIYSNHTVCLPNLELYFSLINHFLDIF